jgi:hypothetical protein
LDDIVQLQDRSTAAADDQTDRRHPRIDTRNRNPGSRMGAVGYSAVFDDATQNFEAGFQRDRQRHGFANADTAFLRHFTFTSRGFLL